MSKFLLQRKFIQHMAAIMKDFKEPQNISVRNRELLLPLQKLAIDLGEIHSDLSTIKEDLNKTIVFLRRFPLKKFYEENDITELDYIKYHLEVFFHKISTGSDLLKLLVNILFELKINNKHCNIYNLRKKYPKEYNDVPFLDIIESYDKTFDLVKALRNKNSHEAKFYDKEFKNLELYLNLYRNSKKVGLETLSLNILMPQHYLESNIKEFRKKRILWIESAIIAYDTLIFGAMDLSIMVYFKKLKKCPISR